MISIREKYKLIPISKRIEAFNALCQRVRDLGFSSAEIKSDDIPEFVVCLCEIETHYKISIEEACVKFANITTLTEDGSPAIIFNC